MNRCYEHWCIWRNKYHPTNWTMVKIHWGGEFDLQPLGPPQLPHFKSGTGREIPQSTAKSSSCEIRLSNLQDDCWAWKHIHIQARTWSKGHHWLSRLDHKHHDSTPQKIAERHPSLRHSDATKTAAPQWNNPAHVTLNLDAQPMRMSGMTGMTYLSFSGDQPGPSPLRGPCSPDRLCGIYTQEEGDVENQRCSA